MAARRSSSILPAHHAQRSANPHVQKKWKLGDKAAIDAALTELEQAAAKKEAGNEPALVAAFDAILEATGDKNKKTRDAAEAAAKAILGSVSPFAIDMLLPSLIKGLSVKAKPTQKEPTAS